MQLSLADMRFFKDNGYLIKRGVLDPQLCAQARDRLWEAAPPRFKRDDVDTWIGPFTAEEEDEDGPTLPGTCPDTKSREAEETQGYMRWNSFAAVVSLTLNIRAPGKFGAAQTDMRNKCMF